MFSSALYFVMAVLQFIAVCLVVILWAFALVFFAYVGYFFYTFCEVRGVYGERWHVGIFDKLKSFDVWVVVEVTCGMDGLAGSMVYF